MVGFVLSKVSEIATSDSPTYFLSPCYSFRYKTAAISILVVARTLCDHATTYFADSLFLVVPDMTMWNFKLR
jgi:hypothetical protein